MRGVGIRSRLGNLALAVLGAAYMAAGISIFIYYVNLARDGASLFDRVLQLGLLGASMASAWLLIVALQNLRMRRPHHR